MKKKWWIIPIIVIVLIWTLFLIQHSLLYKYGCQKGCINDSKWHICATIDYRYKCSFKTFITNDSVSEKIFLWFWIDTRSLKEKPQNSPQIIAEPNDKIWQQNIYLR